MCRSIKTLRPPYAENVTDEEIHEELLATLRVRGAAARARAADGS